MHVRCMFLLEPQKLHRKIQCFLNLGQLRLEHRYLLFHALRLNVSLFLQHLLQQGYESCIKVLFVELLILFASLQMLSLMMPPHDLLLQQKQDRVFQFVHR